MSRLALPILVLLTASTGCSEYVILADPGDPDDADEIEPEEDDVPSPWDSVEAGTVPEQFFAVGWRPLEQDGDGWRPGDLRYDVIDAEGDVAVPFTWPTSTGGLFHLGLQSAGPGRFLVVARLPDGGPDPDPYERRVWLADADTRTVTEILRLGWEGTLTLPQTGEIIDLGFRTTTLRVAADPLWPDRIYVLPDRYEEGLGSVAAPLYSFDWATPDQVVRMWPAEAWLPEGLSSGDGLPAGFPWSLESAYDGQRTRLVIGAEGFLPSAAERSTHFYTWTPSTEAVDWHLDVTDLAVRADASYEPDGAGSSAGTALMQGGGQSVACAPADFSLLRADARLSVLGAPWIECAWSGPLLDATAPTFAYFGASADAAVPGHELLVSHAGADVWAVDRFRDGIETVPFLLRQVVRLDLDL